MKTTSLWTTLTFCLFAGCGSDITPMDGAWSVTNLTFETNDCGMDDVSSDTLPVNISVTGDASIEIDIVDLDTVNCSLAKGRFDCDPIELVFDLTEDEIDAIMTATQTFSGDFSGEHDGTITWHIDYTCEGTQCDLVAEDAGVDIPCTSAANGDMAHTGM